MCVCGGGGGGGGGGGIGTCSMYMVDTHFFYSSVCVKQQKTERHDCEVDMST